MGLMLSGVSASDLILDSQSVSLYVGGSPPIKVWPTRETVQITLGTHLEARDQFRAALTDRGLSYQTVTEIPFEIELVGTGSVRSLFSNCEALTSVPAMDTSQVTNMYSMFYYCSALTHVPDMDTSQVTTMQNMFRGCSALTHAPDMDTGSVTTMRSMFNDCSSLTSAPVMDTSSVTETAYMFRNCSSLTYVSGLDTSSVTDAGYMFYNCASLTDGNVRLIGRHPNVNTTSMIDGSGLTREPFFNPDGTPDDGIEVHQVSVSGKSGSDTAHPLVTVTVPAGETWSVRVQGTMQSSYPTDFPLDPQIRIGSSTSSSYGNGAAVDYSGTITASNSTIALVTAEESLYGSAGFTGTVTIEKIAGEPIDPDAGEPIDPERVTVTTDGNGWFDPSIPVSSPLVNSINSDWLLVTAAPVISTVALRDPYQERSWEPGEVISAGSALYVPPEVVQGEMQVILAEPHDTAHYPQAVVGLAGPGEWETSTQAQWQRVVDEAVGMGMKWIRVTAPWKLIEPDRGVRDWSELDSRISACTTAGLLPLVLILGQPDWALGIHTTQASAMSGWSDFCAALADRYRGQVTAYEVWNEPNLDRFWDEADATTYVELLKAASAAIRGADPSALIVSAGLAPATTAAGESVEPLEFLQSILDGASSHLDHVGWHPYCWPDRPLSGAPWSTWTKMHAARQKMASAGVTGQLWLTEFGMPTDGGEGAITEQEQADQLVEGIRNAALESHIGPLFVYCLDDGAAGGGTEGYFGLIREDGTPKPARGVVSSETRRTPA